MVKAFGVVAVLITLMGTFGQAQTACDVDSGSVGQSAQFLISAGTIKLPVGVFVLIRKSGHIGAIRLTQVDASATEWIGKSSYESVFETNGQAPVLFKTAVRKSGELDVQALKGPGRGIFIYQPGNTTASVGPWKFSFGSPTMMTMSDTSFWTGVGDHGFEFAPTSACKVSDLDANDKHLRWFRYDEEANVTLSLRDLPK